MKLSNLEVIVPAGQYVLGDPCYAVPDEHWDDLLASCDYFHSPVGHITIDYAKKFHVLGFGTRWGDGCYSGSDGKEYPVDAGLIGLVPIELVEDVSEHYGNIVTFNKDTICRSNGDGKLYFGSIVIDTDPEDEEEENDW
jgi:hypothetical protein